MVKVKQKYLVINSKGSARLCVTKPSLDWNEIAVEVNIQVPDSVFDRPMLKANIEFKGDFHNEENAEVIDDLKNFVEQNPNIHLLNLEVVKKDEEGKKESN